MYVIKSMLEQNFIPIQHTSDQNKNRKVEKYYVQINPLKNKLI